MKLHRVQSKSIPVSELKPKPTTHKSKRLRWFRHETPLDYDLGVEDEREDGTFVIVIRTVQPELNVAPGQDGHISIVNESLDQATVDMIERSGGDPLLGRCEFVIFQSSPKAREMCSRKAKPG